MPIDPTSGETIKAPAELTGAEVVALWQGERRAMRLYVAALSVLAAGFGLVAFIGLENELRYLVLLAALMLLGGALYVQFAIRCPRCNARLGTQSLMLLPDSCKCCGVSIARPTTLDTELDV